MRHLSIGLIASGVGALAIGCPATAQTDHGGKSYFAEGHEPPGSYQKSCEAMVFAPDTAIGDGKTRLGALCHTKNKSTRYSLIRWYTCKDGSISNEDGTLTCEFDKAKSDALRLEVAHRVFAAQAVLILGRDATDHELGQWSTAASMKGMSAIEDFSALDFAVATAIVKSWLVAQSPYERGRVIDAAYTHVYGNPDTIMRGQRFVAEVASGKAWYASMVGTLNQDKADGPKHPTAPATPSPAATNLPPIH